MWFVDTSGFFTKKDGNLKQINCIFNRDPKRKALLFKYKSMRHLRLLVYSLYLLASSFISCSPVTSSGHPTNTVKIIRAVNYGTPARISPPKLTFINTANQPKIVKAGNPIRRSVAPVFGNPFFTNYGTDEGLPIHNIICGAADKAGNLWFGTGGGGVSKYDGKNFTNYSMANGLAGNIVFCIIEDKDSNLWFGTTSGLSKYDGKRFINYTTSSGLAGNFITCMLQDKNGNIWFGTHEGGLSKFDGKVFENYSRSQGLPDNYIHCMMQDSKGNLWFGTDAGGASRYEGTGFVNYAKSQGLPDNCINALAEDEKGHIWLGTNEGVSRYNGTTFSNYTTKQGLADNNVHCILQDEAGNLWFGTHTKGVSRYDGHSFSNFSRTEGLPGNKINSILEDGDGNLWFTSQGGGVSKRENNSFTYYTVAQGLAGNLIFWITQDKAGNLWFASYEGGVSKFDGKCFSTYTTAQGLADNTVWTMMPDKDGNMWFGTDKGGVSKFDGKSFINYTTAQGLASNAVISMTQDRAGNFWFGTRDGVSKFNDNCFTNYTTFQGLPGNNIWSIVQDKMGSIWFGTHGDGVSKYDGKAFTNYTTAQGLADNAVSSIIQDQNGNLWFGTDGKGISKYDGNGFTNYTTEQGLADNDVWGIAEDRVRNIIWFGTNRGLSSLKESLTTKGNQQDVWFKTFNKNSGYPLKDVSNCGPFVDNNGIIWMASGEGELIRFDYSTVDKKNTARLNVTIQNIKINNENICWNYLMQKPWRWMATDSLSMLNEMMTSFGKVLSPIVLDSMKNRYADVKFDSVAKYYPLPVNLVLPYKDNNITIEFAAIAPAWPKQIKYQYQLLGYNDYWTPLSDNSTASFGNLNAGDYIFKLRAIGPFGMYSEKEYAFKVLPPWWLTWWADILYGMIAVLILNGFYKRRIGMMRRRQANEINIILTAQEEERRRISRDLHDDIGAKLTNINMLSALSQQRMGDSGEIPGYLKRISIGIQAAVEALDDIVWSIDSKNDSIEEVTKRMRRCAAEVFDETAIEYTVMADERLFQVKLTISQRRDLFLVFQEIINNIKKHSAATRVNINIEAVDNGFFMEVVDNGKGFNVDQTTYRNGLRNMKERMQKWGGVFVVESSQETGTICRVRLPISTPSLKRGMWGGLGKR
ncbi:MAG: ligand-binding sensor domain-containing protein [Flavisolibacter sp.]